MCQASNVLLWSLFSQAWWASEGAQACSAVVQWLCWLMIHCFSVSCPLNRPGFLMHFFKVDDCLGNTCMLLCYEIRRSQINGDRFPRLYSTYDFLNIQHHSSDLLDMFIIDFFTGRDAKSLNSWLDEHRSGWYIQSVPPQSQKNSQELLSNWFYCRNQRAIIVLFYKLNPQQFI